MLTSHYGYPLEFQDIPNIHAMRSSLIKTVRLGYSALSGQEERDSGWYNEVEQQGWLDHVGRVLNAANRVAALMTGQAMEESGRNPISVLVHCSDGWDRTSQIVTTAQLLMDPYFRTVEGFEVLIEKDWCEFGHKFSQRMGHEFGKKPDEQSPIFLQFLDAVWQIMRQFPTAFQFNERLLVLILHTSTSCMFGNFLFNSRQEREVAGVFSRTQSVWSYVNDHLTPYLNPHYRAGGEGGSEEPSILVPRCDSPLLQLWPDVFLSQPAAGPSATDELLEAGIAMRKQEEHLRKQVAELLLKSARLDSHESAEHPVDSANGGATASSLQSHHLCKQTSRVAKYGKRWLSRGRPTRNLTMSPENDYWNQPAEGWSAGQAVVEHVLQLVAVYQELNDNPDCPHPWLRDPHKRVAISSKSGSKTSIGQATAIREKRVSTLCWQQEELQHKLAGIKQLDEEEFKWEGHLSQMRKGACMPLMTSMAPIQSSRTFSRRANSNRHSSLVQIAKKEGFLMKTGQHHFFTRWLRRWCVLDQGRLDYFESSAGGVKQKGSIFMADVTGTEKGTDQLCMNITVEGSSSRVFVFKASSPQERDDWVDAVTLHMKTIQLIEKAAQWENQKKMSTEEATTG
ncbi:hypothetical protein CYMTET_23555 [Cymbomonas tetramitiformis]|uniref:Phosphatidylinositol-3-phosphatase n=1 Tax=Cymbomonas tetramitiformis TaxID=36881 RepID=A0AAE0FY25_9CHLO|nr:hypothetical protein CYMTET_23555 [Cymbomonas tetramitiformis]